jgi:hypothetical protein
MDEGILASPWLSTLGFVSLLPRRVISAQEKGAALTLPSPMPRVLGG